MDLLKAELERKRKQAQQKATAAVSNDSISTDSAPEKKYFRRGDFAEDPNKKTQEYWQKYYEKNKVQEYKRPKNEPKASTEEALKILERGKSWKKMPREDVVRKLRSKNQPIRLFGESDKECFRRLRRVEIDFGERMEGSRNDFRSCVKTADEVIHLGLGTSEQSVNIDVSAEKAKSIEEIKYILQKWGQSCRNLPENQKKSSFGIVETARHAQTLDHFRPLLHKLKTQSLASDMRVLLIPITRHLLDGEYLQAQNSFLELSIGNVPWPVGVTRTNPHLREGAEDIYETRIQHVMNDETQRKYIQGMKRLMTKCQEFFPSDPSKSQYMPLRDDKLDFGAHLATI